MHRFVTRWHRHLACLGLLALGLAIGGPLLSQTQRLLENDYAAHGASHHGGHSTAPHASPDAAHPGHGARHSEGHHHAQHGQHETLAACDYCTFFLHMPGAAMREVNAISRRPVSPAPLAIGPWRPGGSERYPRYRGRAPPLRSV